MKERVKEWIERGERDLAAAELLFDKSEYFDVVLFHLHQAVEKFLKGFLIHSGWRLKKIHDLETLITEAIDFDGAFEKYLDLARKLTAFYYQERYPPGPVSPLFEGGNCANPGRDQGADKQNTEGDRRAALRLETSKSIAALK